MCCPELEIDQKEIDANFLKKKGEILANLGWLAMDINTVDVSKHKQQAVDVWVIWCAYMAYLISRGHKFTRELSLAVTLI